MSLVNKHSVGIGLSPLPSFDEITVIFVSETCFFPYNRLCDCERDGCMGLTVSLSFFQEFSTKQLLSVVNCVCRSNKKTRQKLSLKVESARSNING